MGDRATHPVHRVHELAWLTPRQLAAARQVRVGKVLAWISSGELRAVNCAERTTGRPRWRISVEAMEAFDAARSNRPSVPAAVATGRRPRRDPAVIQYF